jgi:hypothetical protein
VGIGSLQVGSTQKAEGKGQKGRAKSKRKRQKSKVQATAALPFDFCVLTFDLFFFQLPDR